VERGSCVAPASPAVNTRTAAAMTRFIEPPFEDRTDRAFLTL
jgi:hypothetical protein